MSDSKAKMY